MILADIISASLILLLAGNSIFLLFIPGYALLSSVILLFLLIFLAMYDFANVKMEEVLIAASIFPLLMIALIAIRPSSIYLQGGIVYSLLIVFSAVYQYKFPHIGLGYTKKHLLWLPLVLIIGIFLGTVFSVVLPKNNHIQSLSFLSAIIFIIAAGIAEEIYFRGIVQSVFKAFGSTILSIAYTFFLYILFHVTTLPYYAYGFMVYTLFASGLYVYKKNIFLLIFFNISVNIAFYYFTKQIFLLQVI